MVKSFSILVLENTMTRDKSQATVLIPPHDFRMDSSLSSNDWNMRNDRRSVHRIERRTTGHQVVRL